MTSYVELVRRRFEDRAANIVGNIKQVMEEQLRFMLRVFGDCLDETARKEMLGKYNEYLIEDELGEFIKTFVPAYTDYAIRELEEKKRDGERFDPPFITQEEYQEMAVREKWPRIAEHLDEVPPLQLRREVARIALLFRPYMLSDPGFNEGVLEFSLYFDLLERLGEKDPGEIKAAARAIAPLVAEAVNVGAGESCEDILTNIRRTAARAAGVDAEPEELLGPRMERIPRDAPPEWKHRRLKIMLERMGLRDLRLSALVHIDILTTEETRNIVTPFLERFPNFYEMPGNALRELIMAVAAGVTDREITYFADRYDSGRMMMAAPVTRTVWRLMPEEERIRRLREDNARMDQAMMARHLARFLFAVGADDLTDPGRQIALLTAPAFVAAHGEMLRNAQSVGGEEGLRPLYDEVTVRALRMMTGPAQERNDRLDEIRERISSGTGVARKAVEAQSRPEEGKG